MMHRNAVLERVRAHADQSSEATRVHHASRRRGGLAARGTRAGGACRLLLGGRAKSTELQVSHARTSLSCWLRRARAIDFFSLRRLPRVMLDESKMPASRRLNSGAIYVIHTGRLAPRLNDRWALQLQERCVLSLGPVNHSSRKARHEEPIGAFLPAGSGRNASNPRLLGGDAAFVYWLV